MNPGPQQFYKLLSYAMLIAQSGTQIKKDKLWKKTYIVEEKVFSHIDIPPFPPSPLNLFDGWKFMSIYLYICKPHMSVYF